MYYLGITTDIFNYISNLKVVYLGITMDIFNYISNLKVSMMCNLKEY